MTEANFVKLMNFPSRVYAQMAQDILAEDDIVTMIQGEDTAIFGLSGGSVPGGVWLMVPQKDYDHSRQLLEAYYGDEIQVLKNQS